MSRWRVERLSSFLLVAAGFGGALERSERIPPDLIQVRAERFDAGRIDLINPSGAVGGVEHEMRVLEDAQVLRHGGSAHGQVARQVADGAGTVQQPLENRTSRRVPEGRQLGVEYLVSI